MTAPRYMLDTSIVSDLIRNLAGKVQEHITRIGDHGLAVSIVTAAELRFGAAKRGSPRLSQRVEAALGALTVLPLDVPADVEYADIRRELEVVGQPIGPNDLLIGAHARALGLTLVTANTAEFRRIRRLTVEDWLTGS